MPLRRNDGHIAHGPDNRDRSDDNSIVEDQCRRETPDSKHQQVLRVRSLQQRGLRYTPTRSPFAPSLANANHPKLRCTCQGGATRSEDSRAVAPSRSKEMSGCQPIQRP